LPSPCRWTIEYSRQNGHWHPEILANLIHASLLLTQAAHTRSMAFTFDDGPDMTDNVRTCMGHDAALPQHLYGKLEPGSGGSSAGLDVYKQLNRDVNVARIPVPRSIAR
jgi:hypothetical protein